MKAPQIEPSETELSYLLRVVATDALDIEVRQKAADKAVKILRKHDRNYDAAAIWRFARIVQPGSKFAPMKPPAGYIPSQGT